MLTYDAEASRPGTCEVFRDEEGEVAVVELTVGENGEPPWGWYMEALGSPTLHSHGVPPYLWWNQALDLQVPKAQRRRRRLRKPDGSAD